MMTCLICGWDTAVSYSKKCRREPAPGTAIDLVRRRRKCLRCNEMFWTYERRADDAGELWQALEDALRERDAAERKLARLVNEVAGDGASR